MMPSNGRVIVVNRRHQVAGREYLPDGRVKERKYTAQGIRLENALRRQARRSRKAA